MPVELYMNNSQCVYYPRYVLLSKTCQYRNDCHEIRNFYSQFPKIRMPLKASEKAQGASGVRVRGKLEEERLLWFV